MIYVSLGIKSTFQKVYQVIILRYHYTFSSMSPKLIRSLLIAGGLGFFVLWILEYRRAGMLESYWLLLLSVVSLLFFQINRLKEGIAKKNELETLKPKTTSKNKSKRK
tara:strand:- start:1310 stop:1633 length:324 start_codon:yes stop_codon:yes gene_type:complete